MQLTPSLYLLCTVCTSCLHHNRNDPCDAVEWCPFPHY